MCSQKGDGRQHDSGAHQVGNWIKDQSHSHSLSKTKGQIPARCCCWGTHRLCSPLCTSASPLITPARVLVAQGFASNCMVGMVQACAGTRALPARLGAVAAIRLDGEKALHRTRMALDFLLEGKA